MNKPKIVVTRKMPDEAMRLLEQETELYVWDHEERAIPHAVLLEQIKDAEGILTNVADSISKEVLDAAPCLRVISTMAVGYDNIDVAEAVKRGIVVGHTPGILTEATADLTFALLMAAARRVVEGAAYLKEGKWTSWEPMLLTGQDIYGATIGIIGMGRIGQSVARRAAGFNMNILYHSRNHQPEIEEILHAEYCSLDSLLERSDFVVLLTPSTPETHRMMGKREFSLMKSSAVFINASRGKNVDEQALYDALQSGEIWAAGLDVFDEEPVSLDNPLLALPNVTALPHIGSASITTRTKMAVVAVQNLLAGLAGKELLFAVKGK